MTHAGPTWRWDLVGLLWAEAEAILLARGAAYTTVVTAPPGRPVGAEALRVVAEKPRPEGLLLVLAHEATRRGREE